MAHLTNEKLQQLAALADEQCPSRVPTLIAQLAEKIQRLDEIIPTIGKRENVGRRHHERQAVQS